MTETAHASQAILGVRDLSIDYGDSGVMRPIVMDVSFTIRRGEILGLAGESGSGKSSVLYALLGYVRAGGRISKGSVTFDRRSIRDMPPREVARIRGPGIGIVPQNPTSSLSPHLRIVEQLKEVALWHAIASSPAEAEQLAFEHLRQVGLPDPERLAKRYPHEMSGGQQQRVCIAMALLCKPALLLLDEPTTGLDVTTQAQVITLLRELRDSLGMSMLYVTHDLGVLANIADRLGIMYAGRMVELGAADTLLTNPRHPYTRGLIGSVPSIHERSVRTEGLEGLLRRGELPPGCAFSPRCKHAGPDCTTTPQFLEALPDGSWIACSKWREIPAPAASEWRAPPKRSQSETEPAPILEVSGLSVDYRKPRARRGSRPQVRDLTLELHKGEVLGLVGESGSGKSTIARAICGLVRPVSGAMKFRGRAFEPQLSKRARELKRQIQYVFQNPDASLNPCARIRRILSRPIRAYFSDTGSQIDAKIDAILEKVSLERNYRGRYPGQLSGGERQRVAIARGLLAEPSILLCDEILSALDVSVQASIIDLIRTLRRKTDVTILFISHDLAVVHELSDRVAVLFGGEVVEIGPVEAVFKPPYHPYTLQLLNAIPDIDKRGSLSAKAAAPNADDFVEGCAFRSRCQWHMGEACDMEAPPWQAAADGFRIRCHRSLHELAALAGGGGELASWSNRPRRPPPYQGR